MKKRNSILYIGLVTFFLVLSAVISIPLTNLLENQALSFANRYINTVEELLNSDISFTLADKAVLRHIKLTDVIIHDRSVSRNKIIEIQELMIDYNLLQLLFDKKAGSYPITITVQNMRGVLHDSELNRVLTIIEEQSQSNDLVSNSKLLQNTVLNINFQKTDLEISFRNTVTIVNNLNLEAKVDGIQFTEAYISADTMRTNFYSPKFPFNVVGTVSLNNTTFNIHKNDVLFDFIIKASNAEIQANDTTQTNASLSTINLKGAFSSQTLSVVDFYVMIENTDVEMNNENYDITFANDMFEVLAFQENALPEMVFNISSKKFRTEVRNSDNELLTAELQNSALSFKSKLSIPEEIPACRLSSDYITIMASSPDINGINSSISAELQKPDFEFFKNPTRSTYNILFKTESITSDVFLPFISLSGNGLILAPTILLETTLEKIIDISLLSDTSTFDLLYDEMGILVRAVFSDIYINNNSSELSANIKSDISCMFDLQKNLEIDTRLDVDAKFIYTTENIEADIKLDTIVVDNSEPIDLLIGSLTIDIPSRMISGIIQLPEIITEFDYSSSDKAVFSKLHLDDFSVDQYREQLSLFIDDKYLNILSGTELDGTLSADYVFSDNTILYAGQFSMDDFYINSKLPNISIQAVFEGNNNYLSVTKSEVTAPDFAVVLDGRLNLHDAASTINASLYEIDDFYQKNLQPGIFPLVNAEISGKSLLEGDVTLYSQKISGGIIKSDYLLSSDFNHLDLDGRILYQKIDYPFQLLANLNELSFKGVGGDSAIGITEFTVKKQSGNPFRFSGSLLFADQSIPDNIVPIHSDIRVDAAADFEIYEANDWEVIIEYADIKNILVGNKNISLNLKSVNIIPDFISIQQLLFDDSISLLTGSGEITYGLSDGFFINSLISMNNDTEEITVSYNKSGGTYELSAEISGASLLHAPFDIGLGIVDGSLTISGKEAEYILVSDLSVRNGLMSQKPYSGRVMLTGSESELKIENFSGKYDGNSVENFSLFYDFLSGNIESSSSQQFIAKNGAITFNLNLDSSVKPILSIFDVSINELLSQDLIVNGAVTEILSNGIRLLDDFTAVARISDGAISVIGGPENSIMAEISRDGKIAASFGQAPESSLPFSFSLNGFLKNGQIDVKSEDIEFDLIFLNSILVLLNEFLKFDTGTLYGNIHVIGSLSDPDFFGELYCDYTEISSGILPDRVKAENVMASISGKTLYFVPFYAEIKNNFVKVNMQLDMEYIIPYYYDITVTIPVNEKVQMKKRFNQFGLLFDGMISGPVNFRGAGTDLLITGDIDIDNSIISMTPEGRIYDPDPPFSISAELAITTGNNVTAILPNLDFPIISATIAENQNMTISYSSKKNYQVDGDLKILGGEIFYFQRSFFITNGFLKLKESHLYDFDPVISIEAKLRDFDKNGEKIDIFLRIQNDHLSNFIPVLSSRPTKTVAEIAAILGQNILPENIIGSTNISSALALATIATDIIQKLGIIELDPISDFENIIRNTLQLDLFSIRTQVFQNIILETITNSQVQMLSLNPIARYLDNTTVFLGKYINNDVFLQAMLHLSANDRYGPGLFMTDDLKLDIELSVEWENPLYLLRLSTQPEGLQPYQLLDTLTIGVFWDFSF